MRERARARTLRGRVSWIGLAVIAAWVLALTVAFNVLFSASLNHSLDSLLSARAEATAATVRIGSSGHVSIGEQRNDEALDSGIWVYADGHLVEHPAGGAGLRPVADAIAARHGGYADAPGDFRLFGLPVEAGSGHTGVVVASTSTAPYEHARTTAIEGSAVVALLMLLGAYPVLRFAAGRALRPVDEMAHRAADWSARALNERFGPTQKFQEIRTLAGSLDEVLDRLSAVVRHERRLSAELSHELRTPLSAIIAETDLLLARSPSPQQVATAQQAVRATALEMDRILDTLLSAARVDIQTAPGRCEIGPVVERLARPSRDGAPAVRLEIPDDLGAGVDAAILERILAPILNNAYRYAVHGVTVRSHREPDSVVIEIADDGPGVSADLGEAVFEPGRRGDAEDAHDGAGLGLALARRLARACAGEVTLATGSTFVVRLPPA